MTLRSSVFATLVLSLMIMSVNSHASGFKVFGTDITNLQGSTKTPSKILTPKVNDDFGDDSTEEKENQENPCKPLLLKGKSKKEKTPDKIRGFLEKIGLSTPQRRRALEVNDSLALSPISLEKTKESATPITQRLIKDVRGEKGRVYRFNPKKELAKKTLITLGVSRHRIKEGVEEGSVTVLTSKDYKPLPQIETEEERQERNLARQKLFEELNPQVRQIKGLSVYEKELHIWEPHFQFISNYKTGFKEGVLTRKMSRGDVEASFIKFVACHYTKAQFGPYVLYYNQDFIDLTLKDSKKSTNKIRMESELCPIGTDNREFNYHHLTHHDEYASGNPIIVLITGWFHTKQSGKLHFVKSWYKRPKSVERGSFATWRNKTNTQLVKLLDDKSVDESDIN